MKMRATGRLGTALQVCAITTHEFFPTMTSFQHDRPKAVGHNYSRTWLMTDISMENPKNEPFWGIDSP